MIDLLGAHSDRKERIVQRGSRAGYGHALNRRSRNFCDDCKSVRKREGYICWQGTKRGNPFRNGAVRAEHGHVSLPVYGTIKPAVRPELHAVRSAKRRRQIVQDASESARRYLVIAPGDAQKFGEAVQVQSP